MCQIFYDAYMCHGHPCTFQLSTKHDPNPIKCAEVLNGGEVACLGMQSTYDVVDGLCNMCQEDADKAEARRVLDFFSAKSRVDIGMGYALRVARHAREARERGESGDYEEADKELSRKS